MRPNLDLNDVSLVVRVRSEEVDPYVVGREHLLFDTALRMPLMTWSLCVSTTTWTPSAATRARNALSLTAPRGAGELLGFSTRRSDGVGAISAAVTIGSA